MNEQRLQAYFQLIQNLLDCPSEEEAVILAANRELLDAGFLQVLEAVADIFVQQGEQQNANWLRSLARQLKRGISPITPEVFEAYEQFLLEVLPATAESNGVGYAPSCQLLQQIQLRQRPDFQSFFAIQNPTQDLYEQDLGAVASIKRQFTDAHIFKQDQAKKSAIICSKTTII